MIRPLGLSKGVVWKTIPYSLLAAVILGVAMLPTFDPAISPLVPVLASFWLIIHVTIITASYGFLGLIEASWSMFLFFLVLVQGGWEYGQDMAANDPLYRSAVGIALASIMVMRLKGRLKSISWSPTCTLVVPCRSSATFSIISSVKSIIHL